METKFKFIKKMKNQKGFSLVELDGCGGDYWNFGCHCNTKLSKVSA